LWYLGALSICTLTGNLAIIYFTLVFIICRRRFISTKALIRIGFALFGVIAPPKHVATIHNRTINVFIASKRIISWTEFIARNFATFSRKSRFALAECFIRTGSHTFTVLGTTLTLFLAGIEGT